MARISLVPEFTLTYLITYSKPSRDCNPSKQKYSTTCRKVLSTISEMVSELEYSNVIDFLMYDMPSTKSNIAFVVGKLSRFTRNRSTYHRKATMSVLKYLKKTKYYSLWYHRFPSIVKGYSNANWITNIEEYLSTSGWVFLFRGFQSRRGLMYTIG